MPDTVTDVPADTLPPGTTALGAGGHGAALAGQGPEKMLG